MQRINLHIIRSITGNRYVRFIVRRVLVFFPLLIGVSIVTFTLVRLLPGDAARTLAGNNPYPGVVEGIREHLGLNKPLYTQYFIYIMNILHGDLGNSWFTGNPVAKDVALRAPATLELITYGMIMSIITGLFLGIMGAVRPNGVIDRVAQFYGLLAGALPDFWLALVVILILFYYLHIIPAPLGRLPYSINSPLQITGFLTIDSLLSGNFIAFKAALAQLAGPVLTLTLIFAGAITKMTRSTMLDALHGTITHYARACGLPEKVVIRYAIRSMLPPVMTLIGYLYAFMIGGVVLVENVFSWNGLGQYVVKAIVNKDYSPVQAFVLIAGLFSLLVYLAVDILYMIVDPRVRL